MSTAKAKMWRGRPLRLRGVTRVLQPAKRMKGWFARGGWVKLTDGRYAPAFTRYFADSKYGGAKAAREAAIRWVTLRRREVAKLTEGGRRQVVRARLRGSSA